MRAAVELFTGRPNSFALPDITTLDTDLFRVFLGALHIRRGHEEHVV